VDRLVAWPEKRGGKQVEQLVGTRAAHDVRGIKAVELGDGLPQLARRAVRVTRQVLRLGEIGVDGARGGAERRLVGRELDHRAAAGERAPTRHIGRDVENTLPWLQGPLRRHCHSPGINSPWLLPEQRASHRTFPLPEAKKRLTFGLNLLANAELSNSQAYCPPN